MSVKRDYEHWWSSSLDRKMELLWFGEQGPPLLVFPTSMGRFHQNEDFGLIGALEPLMHTGRLQICCVDSVDEESWYAKSHHPSERVRRHQQYDDYLRQEVIPYVQKRARADRVDTFGASFGAYHAVNFAFRHPQLAHRVIAMSGLYDIHRYLDGYWDEDCYYHCPTAFIANFDDEWLGRISHLETVIATGEHDSLYQANREFADLLARRGIRHHAEFWPGVFGHDWPYWRDNLPRFLG